MSASNGTVKNKGGRKTKLGEAERKQIIVAVRLGGSISDAAGAVGVSSRTVREHMQHDEGFRIGVYQARKTGKMRLIKKVGTSKAWQAAAWMLERKYGKEYGRRERREITGKDGGPIEIDVTQLSDDELETLTRIGERHAAVRRQLVPASEN